MLSDTTALSIRLTESVVPLRSTPARHTSPPRDHDPDAGSEAVPGPAVVRGLLTLRLMRPTKVSSIELEIQAKATTRCMQGTGPAHADATERYKVHSASMFLFKADHAPQLSLRERASSTSMRSTAQFLGEDVRTDREIAGGDGEVPSAVPRSVSLDPRSFSARLYGPGNDGGRHSRWGRMPTDPAPPYPNSAGRRFSSSAISYPFATERSRLIADGPRTMEPRSPSSSILPQNNNPISGTLSRSPSSSTHSTRDLAPPRIEEFPKEDSESSDDDSDICPDDVAYYGLSRVSASSSSRSPEQGRRGRSHSRLPFGNVVQMFGAVKDRLRSRSPRSVLRPPLDEQEERGRSLFKRQVQVAADEMMHALPETEVDDSFAVDSGNEQSGDRWIILPEGTYTYPIFFTIPNDSPPTMRADHGSLIWRIKSKVRQPSVSKSRVTAKKEVIVVCVPRDDEPGEVDGLDLQRQWDDQFQYRLQITECEFPVGGRVPFQLTIMPLAKIKVHSILVHLDERTEYYRRNESRARSDVIRRATLLALKHNNADGEPILPLASNKPEVFRESPLYRFLGPGENEIEVASSFTEPGPWTIRDHLRVPDSCSVLHPSNHAKGSNVVIGHTLRTVLRVEREEAVGTVGRKKLFDVVIHTPVQILSCRCTPAWKSLPQYEDAVLVEPSSMEDVSSSLCPCRTQQQAKARAHSHEPDVAPPSTDFNVVEASLASCTNLHERLMSGLVGARGEAPPVYTVLCVN